MLVTAVDQLEFMAQRRQYGDAANLLNAVNELSKHFEQYTGVPKVDEMRKAVLDTRRALKAQVLQDFRDIQPASVGGGGEYGEFGGGGDLEGNSDEYDAGIQNHAQLHEACLVVDALGGDVRERIMERFCSDQLGVYDGFFAREAAKTLSLQWRGGTAGGDGPSVSMKSHSGMCFQVGGKWTESSVWILHGARDGILRSFCEPSIPQRVLTWRRC